MNTWYHRTRGTVGSDYNLREMFIYFCFLLIFQWMEDGHYGVPGLRVVQIVFIIVGGHVIVHILPMVGVIAMVTTLTVQTVQEECAEVINLLKSLQKL